MNKFIEGFLSTIMMAIIAILWFGLLAGGLYIIGSNIITKFDLYGVPAVIISISYIVIFIVITVGIINTIDGDAKEVITE